MKSKTSIANEFKKRKAITNRGLSKQRDNSQLCEAFYAGNYMDYKGELQTRTRKVSVQFCKVQPYVDSMAGFMIQNRRRAKYVAKIKDEGAREIYSSFSNNIAGFVRGNANADGIESQQDKQMLIKGYGAVETAMTYDQGYAARDPNGEVIMGDVTEDAGWDPMARATNLMDRRWNYYRKSYGIEEAKRLFAENEDDFEIATNDDQKEDYKFLPNGGPYDRYKLDEGFEWDSEENQTIWVYFYEWYEIEDFYRADNPVLKMQGMNPYIIQQAMLTMDAVEAQSKQGDDMFDFKADAERLTFDAKTKALLEEQFGDLIKPFKYTRKVYYRAVLSKDKVFSATRSASQQSFSLQFKTGRWDNHNKIWIGMVNPMMEPTRYYNKSLTELMYTIAANSKGGVVIEDDATDDIADFEAKWNKTDGIVVVNPGAISGQKIMDKRKPFVPTGYENIVQLSDAAVGASVNITSAFLGSEESKLENGVLNRQRVRRVLSTYAEYFESATQYQLTHARLMLDFLRVYIENNAGEIFRVTGEEGKEEYLEISEDNFAAEYDVDIQDAPEAPEEQEQQAQMMISMATPFIATGDPVGKVILASGIRLLNIDESDKRRLTEALVPSEEDPRIAQMQQAIEQLTSQMTKAQQDALMANTELTKAKRDDTIASVHKKAADTAKVMGDIEEQEIKTQIIQNVPMSEVSVSA